MCVCVRVGVCGGRRGSGEEEGRGGWGDPKRLFNDLSLLPLHLPLPLLLLLLLLHGKRLLEEEGEGSAVDCLTCRAGQQRRWGSHVTDRDCSSLGLRLRQDAGPLP